MGYYQGDYFQGGGRAGYSANRGDPFWGALLAKIVPAVVGLFHKAKPAIQAAAGPAVRTAVTGVASRALGRIGMAVSRHPVLSAAGASGTIGALSGAGYTSRRGRMAAMGGGGGRRRMHVTNPKALRRAIRRTTGFAKLAMRTIRLVHPQKKARFGGFKARGRKR